MRDIKEIRTLYLILKAAMRMPASFYLASLGIAALLFWMLRKERLGKRLAVSILGTYLFLVLSSTVIRRSSHMEVLYRLDPFRSYREIFQKGISRTRSVTARVILNLLMLSPIGFLMPAFIEKKRFIILSGFLFSLFIETLQLILQKGYFEVEDLLNNTLGVAIACGCLELMRKIKRLKRMQSIENIDPVEESEFNPGDLC